MWEPSIFADLITTTRHFPRTTFNVVGCLLNPDYFNGLNSYSDECLSAFHKILKKLSHFQQFHPNLYWQTAGHWPSFENPLFGTDNVTLAKCLSYDWDVFALYLCYNEHVFYWLCHWIFQDGLCPASAQKIWPWSLSPQTSFQTLIYCQNLRKKNPVSLQLVKALSDTFWKKRTSLFSLCFPLVTSYADGVAFHCYADDTHIYLHIKFNIPSDNPASNFNIISASLCSPVFNHLLFF